MKLIHLIEADEITVTGRGTILTNFGPSDAEYRSARAGDLVEYPLDFYRLVTGVEMSGPKVGGLVVRPVDWTKENVLPADYVAPVTLKEAMHYVSELLELSVRRQSIFSYQLPLWLLPAYQRFAVGQTMYSALGRSVLYPHDMQRFLKGILYETGLPYSLRYQFEPSNGLQLQAPKLTQALTPEDSEAYTHYLEGKKPRWVTSFCAKYGINPPKNWCWDVKEGIFTLYQLSN